MAENQPKRSEFIPYGRQTIDAADIARVVETLQSDFLTTGPQVDAFEREFASQVGAKHAVAVSNATAALHLAMLVADIGPGDRVITSPNTFLSSANCAAFVGATPDFSDIDPETFNLCPEKLESGWKDDCKAVVAVAYAGQPANMPEIARVARANGAIVIEDACHGIGGSFIHEDKAYQLGGHPWADMTTFSFHPVKTMTTGEGGMLVTDNDKYAELARKLRCHGLERDSEKFCKDTASEQVVGHGPWVYEMQALGYNYRLTDIQCALGRSQLSRLQSFVERRRNIVKKYNEAFSKISWIKTPKLKAPALSETTSWHLYTVQMDFEALGLSRPEVMQLLREQGIGTQVLYIPVYLQPWYRETYDYRPGKCPNAEHFYHHALSLPLYPAMSDADVEHVIHCVSGLGQQP